MVSLSYSHWSSTCCSDMSYDFSVTIPLYVRRISISGVSSLAHYISQFFACKMFSWYLLSKVSRRLPPLETYFCNIIALTVIIRVFFIWKKKNIVVFSWHLNFWGFCESTNFKICDSITDRKFGQIFVQLMANSSNTI